MWRCTKPAAAAEPKKDNSGAVAYLEGKEEFSTESRHFLVLSELSGEKVVGVLEVLSPTNKGYYARSDLESFKERRQRLLLTPISYMEVDATPLGTRWLPRCLKELAKYDGVAWYSIPVEKFRHFSGWAWALGGQLLVISWNLGSYGPVNIDLNLSFNESLKAGGLSK